MKPGASEEEFDDLKREVAQLRSRVGRLEQTREEDAPAIRYANERVVGRQIALIVVAILVPALLLYAACGHR